MTKVIDVFVVLSIQKYTSVEPIWSFHYTIQQYNRFTQHRLEEMYIQKTASKVLHLSHQITITLPPQANPPTYL